MRLFFQRHPLITLLALCAAILVAVIGVEIGFGTGLHSLPEGAPRRAAPFEAKLLPPIVASAPEQLYAQTASRPLWAPSRRPAPEVPVAAASFVKGQFVLLGVTIVGDQRIALVREKSTGRIHRAEVGRELNGLKVAKIAPESVTLVQGSDQEVLTLQVQKSAVGTPALLGPFGGPVAPVPSGLPTVTPVGQPTPASAGQSSSSQLPMPRDAVASSAPAAPQAPNPATSAPAQTDAMPMSPEELLARRRARRNQ